MKDEVYVGSDQPWVDDLSHSVIPQEDGWYEEMRKRERREKRQNYVFMGIILAIFLAFETGAFFSRYVLYYPPSNAVAPVVAPCACEDPGHAP